MSGGGAEAGDVALAEIVGEDRSRYPTVGIRAAHAEADMGEETGTEESEGEKVYDKEWQKEGGQI